MRNIQKKREPRLLTEHRCHENAIYENMPQPARDQLKRQLLEEQGWLCAYCMGRISETDMKVEHVASRHEHPERQLDYSNLVACCSGNEGKRRSEQHCDTHKGSKSLSKNPAAPADRTEESIQYDTQGYIYSTDPVFEKDINDVLNLNTDVLRHNRKFIRQSVVKQLSLLPINSDKNKIYDLLIRWQKRDSNNKFIPYAGVAIFFIKKRLNKNK